MPNRDSLLRQGEPEAEWSVNRRYYVDGAIYELGDWIATPYWVISNTIAERLPGHWLSRAHPPHKDTADEWLALVDRYIAAVVDEEALHTPRFCREHKVGHWNFQSVYGKAPAGINSDVRALFEDITPGAEWRFCPSTVLHNNVEKAGAVFARVESDEILCIVAARDPRYVA